MKSSSIVIVAALAATVSSARAQTVFVDDFDAAAAAARWSTVASEQVSAKLRPAGGELCLDYDFRGVSGISDPIKPYVKPFEDWLVKTVEAGDERALADYENAPEGKRNHPTPDHFLPIFVPFGAALAAGEGKGRTLHRSYTYGIIAMTAFAWG